MEFTCTVTMRRRGMTKDQFEEVVYRGIERYLERKTAIPDGVDFHYQPTESGLEILARGSKEELERGVHALRRYRGCVVCVEYR